VSRLSTNSCESRLPTSHTPQTTLAVETSHSEKGPWKIPPSARHSASVSSTHDPSARQQAPLWVSIGPTTPLASPLKSVVKSPAKVEDSLVTVTPIFRPA
jgi:hypothetical protein